MDVNLQMVVYKKMPKISQKKHAEIMIVFTWNVEPNGISNVCIKPYANGTF
jgi:hypothetical protein